MQFVRLHHRDGRLFPKWELSMKGSSFVHKQIWRGNRLSFEWHGSCRIPNARNGVARLSPTSECPKRPDNHRRSTTHCNYAQFHWLPSIAANQTDAEAWRQAMSKVDDTRFDLTEVICEMTQASVGKRNALKKAGNAESIRHRCNAANHRNPQAAMENFAHAC
jgi:hypothetical protein